MGNTHFTVEKTIHQFSGRMLVFFFFLPTACSIEFSLKCGYNVLSLS